MPTPPAPRLKSLLFQMLRIRSVETAIAERYARWQMRCPTHLSIGQEAVAAATGLALRNSDFALSTHRCHAHYLGKGGDLKAMLAEIHGKATGCSRGKGGSMHLIDRAVGFMGSTAIVGNTIPLAVGLGLSLSLRGSDSISCVFFGDAAVEEGAFYESVNFAVLKRLPVLFVAENNGYSVYSPLAVRQPPGRRIAEMVAGMGIATTAGDGNDAPLVLEMAEAAVAAIRAGGGPRFVEFSTYRWREHCGPNYDNDLGYRSEAEFQARRAEDPIPRLERLLRDRSALGDEELREVRLRIEREVESAFDYAEGSPYPAAHEALQDVYRATQPDSEATG